MGWDGMGQYYSDQYSEIFVEPPHFGSAALALSDCPKNQDRRRTLPVPGYEKARSLRMRALGANFSEKLRLRRD